MKGVRASIGLALATSFGLLVAGCTCAQRSLGGSQGGSGSRGSGSTGSATSTTGDVPRDVPEGCFPELYGECDPWCQNCPEGQKCMPSAQEEGTRLGPTRCVEVAPGAAGLNETCTKPTWPHEVGYLNPDYDGTDDCDEDTQCFGIADGMPICVPFCGGGPEAPDCTHYHPASPCDVEGHEGNPACLPPCMPLFDLHSEGVFETCPSGLRCSADPTVSPWSVPTVPRQDVPVMRCSGVVGGGGALIGIPCDEESVCDARSACVARDLVPYCEYPEAEGAGCCARYCDLDAPECPEGGTCTPYLDPSLEAPGFERLGVCIGP